MFNASRRAVKGGRGSRVSKQNVANATSIFRYYVPNQWQGKFDRYIEVSRMCEELYLTSTCLENIKYIERSKKNKSNPEGIIDKSRFCLISLAL